MMSRGGCPPPADQGHVGVHSHELKPRLMAFADVPAHERDGHAALRTGAGLCRVPDRRGLGTQFQHPRGYVVDPVGRQYSSARS